MLKECYVQLLLAAAAALRWSIYRVGRVSLLLRLDILTASVHPIIQSSNHPIMRRTMKVSVQQHQNISSVAAVHSEMNDERVTS